MVIEIIKRIGSVPHKYGDYLSKEYPFSFALLHLDVIESEEISTACLRFNKDKQKFEILVNTKFIDEVASCGKMNAIQKEAFVRLIGKHEILHFLLKHFMPDKKRNNRQLANFVQDALINSLIFETKQLWRDKVIICVTPEEVIENEIELFDQRALVLVASDTALSNNFSWEEYYDHIEKNYEPDDIDYRLSPRPNEREIVEDYEEEEIDSATVVTIDKIAPQPNDVEIVENRDEIDPATIATIDSIAQRLSAALKNKGTDLGNVDRAIQVTEIIKKRFRVMQKIQQIFARGMNITKVDTYKRPHRRFNCFPGRRTTYATCRVVVLIDVSGSVGDESLQYCVNTIAAMAKAYSCALKIFTYDYGIQREISFREFKKQGLSTKGGGGTSLIKALKEIDENELQNALVFVFTDGYDEPPSQQSFKNAKAITFVFYPDYNDQFLKEVQKYAEVEILPTGGE